MVLPSTGLAEDNAGAMGAEPIVQVQMVLHAVVEHPVPAPPDLCD